MKKTAKNSVQVLHQFFENQVAIQPDKTAVICDTVTLTYSELNKLANQLAHYLKTQGIGSGSLVGLFMDHSIYEYISILAILKVGAAYVPMDPFFPIERVRYITNDCHLAAIIASNNFVDLLNHFPCPILNIDDIKKRLSKFSAKNLNESVLPENVCYIIYTSGTTGKPKGVAVTHLSVCNYVDAVKKVYQVNKTDRVYQGFSIAFDASIEEIWNAFAAGAVLITSGLDSVRSGASLVDFLNQQHITVFSCVPTLLSMLEGEVKSLRLLILGGEVCPKHLINEWSRPGLLILNTYGPTECTVVATYSKCSVDKPITIGKSIANCDVTILDKGLKPVPPGEVGELCVSGVCLAKEYINQPELTQKKFIHLPSGLRLYRSGDLGRFNAEGDIEFLGRLDEQVKLRGFRIELAEIENVLEEYAGIKQAAVIVQELAAGVESLIAYLVLEPDFQLDVEKLTAWLSERLPRYMVPSVFEVLAELPKLASGKVDRSHLPKPQFKQSVSKTYVAPRTPEEKKIAEVWERLLSRKQISIKADFFRDLGGHSLYAARIISELRKDPEMQTLSMVDLYQHPTIEQLAKQFAKNKVQFTQKVPETARLKSHWRYYVCGMGQLFGCYLTYAVISLVGFLSLFLFFAKVWQSQIFSVWQLIGMNFGIVIAIYLTLFVIPFLAKWLLLGKIKAGNYPLWGWYYWRWWLVQRLLNLAPTSWLIGSPLIIFYARCMGAKIGKNCYLGTDVLQSFDLITIGANSSIGVGADLSGYIVEDGWLKIGSIHIGDDCYIGSNSIVSRNARMENGGQLADLSMLPTNGVIPKAHCFHGSPARQGSLCVVSNKSRANVAPKKRFAITILHLIGIFFIGLFLAITVIPGIIFTLYIYFTHGLGWGLLATFISGLSFVLLFSLLSALAKKLILGNVQAGEYEICSVYYVRKWLVDRLMSLSLLLIRTLYATLYVTFWLRLLGVKIGKHAEVSTVTHLSHDLVTIDAESFIADSVYLGTTQVYRGYMLIKPTVIGTRSFVGNGAMLPSGTELGDHNLLGCLSVPPAAEEAKKSGKSWFGAPAIYLPRREIYKGFSEEQTYFPTAAMIIKRGIIDYFRVTLPATSFFIALLLAVITAERLIKFPLWFLLLLFPLIYFGITLLISSFVIILKWLINRKFKHGIKPFWSYFVWLDELITGLYESVIVALLLQHLLGTPFMQYVLKLLGMKIGKRVYFNTTHFTEFDLVSIGNDVALNRDCTLQTHLFEDRVMKMDVINIAENCNVGIMSIILYETRMKKNSSLGNLSLLMKGEILPSDTYWQGIPAQRSE